MPPLAYPLDWPGAQPRTRWSSIRRSNYDRERSLYAALAEVQAELRRVHADAGAILSTNVQLRRDGKPYSGMKQPEDRGVALYFRVFGTEHVLACDGWDRVEDNVWAIATHMAALRALDRTRVGTQEQAFAGYKALPAPDAPQLPAEPWHEVLLVAPDATIDVIDAAYVALARKAHPDAGGSDEAMARLNGARQEARAARP